jgi:hypothetical protein
LPWPPGCSFDLSLLVRFVKGMLLVVPANAQRARDLSVSSRRLSHGRLICTDGLLDARICALLEDHLATVYSLLECACGCAEPTTASRAQDGHQNAFGQSLHVPCRGRFALCGAWLVQWAVALTRRGGMGLGAGWLWGSRVGGVPAGASGSPFGASTLDRPSLLLDKTYGTMACRGLSFLATLLCVVCLVSAQADIALDCLASNDARSQKCFRALADVTTVIPGSFYVAKLPCLDCPVVRFVGEGKSRKHMIAHERNALVRRARVSFRSTPLMPVQFFNLTLSHDRTQLLMNSKPVFPTLTIDPSTAIYAEQVDRDFNRVDLDTALDCSLEHCGEGGDKVVAGRCWCVDNLRSSSAVNMDFDYSATPSKRPEDKLSWTITFDAIGGLDGFMDPAWVFNRTDQKMLSIVVDGTPIDDDEFPTQDQSASTLFGEPVLEREQRFRLSIQDVMFVMRTHDFTEPPGLGLWGRIRHFFGFDPKRSDGHIVYIHDEWAEYGRKGTLRNKLGSIIYGLPWILIGIITVSVLVGLLVILGLYRLFFVVKQQSELASWKGMDEVWEQLRRDSVEDEEEGLLHGQERYRDEPTPRISSEPFVDKPLPSKPLPEKPLPAVPLVDT